MRIFNADKTKEITSYDREKGYLAEDKLLIAHHEAVEAQEGEWHYITVAEYPNGGKDVERVWDKEPVEAAEAYDEYEDIQVFIEYTEEEMTDRKRAKRRMLLGAFDKWEKAVLRGREADDGDIMEWYRALLELDEEALGEIPERVRYYF